MRTFASVFPHVMLMTSGNKDFYFLGSNEPWQIDYSRIEKTINENPQMALDLARLDLGHPFTLLSTTFLLNDTQFREMAGNGPLHLDDKPTLEFTSPRNLYSSLSQYIETEISKYRTDTLPEGLIGFNPTKKEWGLLYNLTAESYLRQQNLAGAQRAVQKALEMDPLSARAWANSGRIDNLLTKHFQAERSYRKAIELDKSYALPWFHMGMLYLEQGQEDQALQFLMEGHKRAPTDPIGTIQVANLQMKRGQFKEARALVEKAIEHPSTNPEIYASLQSLLQTIKQKSPAP
jgi:tetratricopeptide (TPR) repeat protein